MCVFTKCFVRMMKKEPEQFSDDSVQIRTFKCSKAEKTFAYRDRVMPLTGKMTYQEAHSFFHTECVYCKRFRQKLANVVTVAKVEA